MAIIIGLLTAFAMQFLLTNLGLALGISLLKYQPQGSSKEENKSAETESNGISIDIGFLAGLGILLTLNSVLFSASFLAVRFSTASDPVSGATLGIVIWSTYFLILIWVSYNAAGSITGWVFGSVATKLRQLITVISNAVNPSEESDNQLLTEAAAGKLIQQEIQEALNKIDLKQRIDEYLAVKPDPQLDLSVISQGFTDLISKLNLESLASSDQLPKVDRQTWSILIKKSTNLDQSQIEQVVDRIEQVWQQAIEGSENQDLNQKLRQFLESADPHQLQSEQLVKRLEPSLAKESQDTSVATQKSPQVESASTDNNHNSDSNNWGSLDWRAIKSTLLTRVDLSDVELEDVWHNLQALYQQFDSTSESPLAGNTISNDIEDYLWHTPPWYLNCEQGWQEFKEVIYDPQADPKQVRAQLELVDSEDWIQLLQQRDNLNHKRIESIVEHLEVVRQEVFELIEQAELAQQKQELSDRFKDYLLQAEAIELEENKLASSLEQLLIESGVATAGLIQFLDGWQQLDWETWLQQREDLSPNQIEQTVEKIVKIGDRLQAKVKDWQVQISATAEELQHKLESYLRYTNLDHLTPDKIATKLEQLEQETRTGLPQMWQQLPTIDLAAALEILDRRKGVEQEQIKVITEQITTNWQQLNEVATPESQLETKSTELSEKLVDDLYQKIADNLDQTEAKVDLSPLLDVAQGKTRTIVNQQLARIDWHDLEARLKQVQHGSEQQVKQTIKQAREAAHQLIRMPRRWATRTSTFHRAQDLAASLKDFLSHGNKLELDAENLENNLKSIFRSVKTQIKSDDTNKQHDLTKLSPASMSQLLDQRTDLTLVEKEQISDRTLEIIEQLSTDIKTQQQESNQVLQDLSERLEDYFSSLDLWHFDYADLKESIRDYDFQSLTDSWQKAIADTPLSEIGDRLKELSQESIAKISETNELFHSLTSAQIQQIQDYLAQQIETVKLTVEERTTSFKQQTLQQVEATRKAIAVAAYWLFAITFTSALASAVAGFLATQPNL